MDGLLIIDKPAGPTSHDVVARMRRALHEPRIGHTGTLDPAATGVLLLVLGRATRLAKFLSASDKSYEAVVRFGFSTDTLDARGRTTGPVSLAALPSREAIDTALDAFRGTFLQQPPAFSAKKIDGTRSHKLARARVRAANAAAALPAPPAPSAPPALPALPARSSVTAHAIDIVDIDGDRVTLRLDCSSGFYVRSLAHDLGERLGVGAHLATLRRVRTAAFTVDQAIDLDTAERDPRRAAAAVIPLADMLPDMACVVLTLQGVRRAGHGCELGPKDTQTGFGVRHSGLIRLLDPAGELVGIARPGATPGLLHPSIVLM
jgi:tRNA pseudouridine55 synthase